MHTEKVMNEQNTNVDNCRQLSICDFLDKIKKDQEQHKEKAKILTLSVKIIEKKYGSNKLLEKAIQYSKSLNW